MVARSSVIADGDDAVAYSLVGYDDDGVSLGVRVVEDWHDLVGPAF